jgi:hypothetical protein
LEVNRRFWVADLVNQVRLQKPDGSLKGRFLVIEVDAIRENKIDAHLMTIVHDTQGFCPKLLIRSSSIGLSVEGRSLALISIPLHRLGLQKIVVQMVKRVDSSVPGFHSCQNSNT